MEITIYKWEPGVQTISLMRWLVRETGVTMHEAKQSVDAFLLGQDIVAFTTSKLDPKTMSTELAEIGVHWK